MLTRPLLVPLGTIYASQLHVGKSPESRLPDAEIKRGRPSPHSETMHNKKSQCQPTLYSCYVSRIIRHPCNLVTTLGVEKKERVRERKKENPGNPRLPG